MCKVSIASLRVSVFPTKLALTEPSLWRLYLREKSSQMMNYPSSSSDIKSLQLAVEGEGSFNSIIQCCESGRGRRRRDGGR